jgi:hypothetical protein
MEKRHSEGIKWTSFPSLSIITPKGNYFPVPYEIKLGDRVIAEKYLEDHLLNFTKGLLKLPDLSESVEDYFSRHDGEVLDRLPNVRALSKTNFQSTVSSSDLDIVAFVYTSDNKHHTFDQ